MTANSLLTEGAVGTLMDPRLPVAPDRPTLGPAQRGLGSPIRVFAAHKASDGVWDDFVDRHKHATFCHQAGWRDLMRDVLGHEDRSTVAMDDEGNLRGLLPLVRVRSRMLGHYLVSMPFLNAGGPIGTDAAISALTLQAKLDAQSSRADLLEIRSRMPLERGLRRTDRKITVQKQLAATKELNWSSLHSKVRSQVRRPQKENLETRFGLDQREAFYDVFSRTMRVLGTPVLPAALFEGISRTFADSVVFGVVWKGDEPIAAGCGFVWRDQFELTWAGSLREHKRIAPNMLLYWEFMERARELGVRTFDFGRCTPGGGTHAFKKQWGGVDVALPWAQWSAREVKSTPTADHGPFKLASACWRHLPLAVTNRVGPWLAAKLP